MNIFLNWEVLLTLKYESWILHVFILLEWNYEETVLQESNQYWCIFLILFLMFTGVYSTSRCVSAGACVYEWEWMGARVECCWIDSRGKWCGLTIGKYQILLGFESVRNCSDWNVLESFLIEKWQNWKVSELKSVRMERGWDMGTSLVFSVTVTGSLEMEDL